MAKQREKPDAGTPPQSAAPGRWMRIVLVLSLAANLLVVGAVAGALLSHGPWQHPRGMRPGAAIAPLIQALSEADRRAIGREIRGAWRQGRAHFRAERAELEALAAELTGEPFEPAAVEARLARLREVIGKRMDLGLDLLSRRLTKMDPQERAAYAKRLREELARRDRYRK